MTAGVEVRWSLSEREQLFSPMWKTDLHENVGSGPHEVTTVTLHRKAGKLHWLPRKNKDNVGHGLAAVYWQPFEMQLRFERPMFSVIKMVGLICVLAPAMLWGETDCEAGNGLLDFAQPKSIRLQEVIQKLGAAEAAAKGARNRYTYTQEARVQTLSGTSVTGEFRETLNVSYDERGRRREEVTLAPQNSLRAIQLSAEDFEDIRTFMPLMLTSDDLQAYNLTYAGQQHVDDLDTYVFHVEAKKEEKD